MLKLLQSISAALVLACVSAGVARADSYDDTIHTFKQAGKSSTFFAKAYGYAVFSDRRRRWLLDWGGSW